MSMKRKMSAAVDNLKHGLWVVILSALAGIITVVLMTIIILPAVLTGSLVAILFASLVSMIVGIMVIGWIFMRFYKRR